MKTSPSTFLQFLLSSCFHPLYDIFSSSCKVLSSRPTNYLVTSSLSIVTKNVHESATQLHTMMTHMSLYDYVSFFKSIAIDHYMFLILKLNQIYPLVFSIFKSNSTSLQQVHILKSVMNISLLEYMLEILYMIMNLYLKRVTMIFLVNAS